MKMITFFVLFVSCWASLESFQRLAAGESLFKNIYAGFCNQNFLGYFLFLFSPLIFSYFFINSPFHGTYRKGRFILLAVVTYAFILSSSRSSWNGFIFAFAFLISRKRKALSIGILLLTIMVNILIYIFRGGGIYQSTWDEVYADRPVWSDYWESASKNTFLALGWGVFPEGVTHHAHNLYLSDVTQMGIFSIFLIIALYGFFFYSSHKAEKRLRDPHLKAILLGSTATYVGHLEPIPKL
ncbi:MAG: O-antigen ligase family protein [bacterium]